MKKMNKKKYKLKSWVVVSIFYLEIIILTLIYVRSIG